LCFSLSSNVLSLRARSLHSLPDSWQPGTFPYTFSLAMPLANPTSSASTASAPSASSSRGIVVPQGALKLCPDKDHSAVSAHWRWPHLPGVTTNASLVEGCPMEPRPLEEEVGQLNTKQVNTCKLFMLIKVFCSTYYNSTCRTYIIPCNPCNRRNHVITIITVISNSSMNFFATCTCTCRYYMHFT
jgi:hypothetical protein